MSTATKLDALTWFKNVFEMDAGAVRGERKLCPCCGSRNVQVIHRQDTEFARARPTWSCLRCRKSGVGVFSLVRAISPKLATLDAGKSWLTSQGVEVSDEIYQTGYGQFPLGAHGRNLTEQAASIAKAKAQHERAMDEVRQAAESTVEGRIAALEKELSELKAGRAKK